MSTSALSSGAAASVPSSSGAPVAPAASSSSASSLGPPNYKFVSATPGGHRGKPIATVKFAPDGQLLATAGADGSIRVYRVRDPGLPASVAGAAAGEAATALVQFLELPGAHELNCGINDLAFTPDSRYLISASDDRTCIIWDLQNGGKPLRTYKGHTSYVFCLAVSPPGNLLVTGSYDETVRVWDLKNARCTRTINAHSDPVSAVDFNRDGSLIVSSSYDGLCRVWDTSSGRCLKTIYNDKTPPVSFVRFSPNGKFILASSLDSTLRLWDYSRKDHCLKEYRGHVNTKYCMAACFSTLHAPRQYIVSGSEDGRIVWWDVSKDGEEVAQPRRHKEAVLCLAAHPTIPILVSASMEAPYELVLWKHQPIAQTATQ